MKRLYLTLFICLSWAIGILQAQSLEKNIEDRLREFFTNYETSYANIGKSRLDKFVVDHDKKRLDIYANKNFGYQPFTEENTTAIYRSLKQLLPGPVNYYDLTVYADGQPIENLVPNAFRSKKEDKSRQYGKIDYKGAPWVTNTSRPFEITRGLQNRHLAVWQSHGRYYKNDKNQWVWQRPRLFGTTEDLFTQSIVVPYLIPMLENAGAVVFTPRERDWQRQEVIVDNNTCTPGSKYLEINYKKDKWQPTGKPGFAQKYLTYRDGNNPFTDGTARFIRTQPKPEKAFAEWIPNIPEKGRYAVYVSYQTLPESVTDAKYLVFHNGGVTEFKVNQQIGGGTWVYLGTFEFDKGANDYGMVVLSNESKQKGVVCADAVRFGGGMGNIVRGNGTSGLPRYLEGARYWAQWAGMPYSVYSKSNGANDYNDDINTRSLMTNYLSGGSIYNPSEPGLKVPFELALALHSDAGYKDDNALVGTLGIYTTDTNDGKLNSGISRYASRDLADMVLTGLRQDISARFGIPWARRSLWNRNYSETRLPAIPSVIIESLSHQNFADLTLGFDPTFQFTVGRSVYKSILKYLANMHGTDYTVQPLPVNHFAIREGKKKHTFELSWLPVEDALEPTATPQGYIVYTRIGYGGWDNGVYVKRPNYTVEDVEPGLVYSFKVTAVNRGGESFPSEILAAYQAKRSKGTILLVNAFDRTCGPATVNTSTQQGFDLRQHPGIPYIQSPAFCGYQQNFDRTKAGKETADGLGYTDASLEGMLIAGNTFDYPFVHGKAIQAAGRYSFVSCSDEAFESSSINPDDYFMVDLIYGGDNKSIPAAISRKLTSYCEHGGKVLISGSYLISNTSSGTPESSATLRDLLKFAPGGSLPAGGSGSITGTGIRFSIPRSANPESYAVPTPECLLPTDGSFAAFAYNDGNYAAGTAYRGNYRTFALGFPFESIRGAAERAHIMKAILGFFEAK